MIDLDDIRAAGVLLAGVAERTPLIQSSTFSRLTGSDLFLKAENMQRTGSFKIRGAYVRIARLSPQERAKGVIAASAGNHAQGVAVAASVARIPAVVVMPEFASIAKVTATRSYGAEVVLNGRAYDDAYTSARKLQKERGLTFVHPFDDWDVIAGQGTVGLEILEDLPDADAIVVPVGGGGLIAGVAIAAKTLRPDTKVIGVQAAGAPSCYESFKRGHLAHSEKLTTIADGIAIKSCGHLTFPVIKRLVDDIVIVEDDAIVHAIVTLLERCKLLVEAAGAVGLAALLTGKLKLPGQKVAVVLSGGNIDVNLLARVIEHGLTAAGRYTILRARLRDEPGQLLGLLKIVAEKKANIVDVAHHRFGLPLSVNEAEVELTIETRDPEHSAQILRALLEAGYEVTREGMGG
ncbi:MAG: threonine ammonia-lyase [Chloroflexi bacterium]|nr:threonine ammonia-lyase [Chloroflexota bacterium]